MKAVMKSESIKTITTHYMDGAYVESHGREVMDRISPTTGQVIGHATLGDEEDATRAIAATKRAFATFGRSTKEERSNSICAELMLGAERELSAFFSAVAELFGPEQASLAANDWLQQLEVMTDLPGSPREWRALSIEAAARLAKRLNANRFAASR